MLASQKVSMSSSSIHPEQATPKSHPLDFELKLFDAVMPIITLGENKLDATLLIDCVEHAAKIVPGMGAVCKLVRNNQDIEKEEEAALTPATLQYLLDLAEVASELFVSEVESLAYEIEQPSLQGKINNKKGNNI